MPDSKYRVLKPSAAPPSLPVGIRKQAAPAAVKKESDVRREEPAGKKADGGEKKDGESSVDVVRGSSDITLSPYGLQQALDVAKATKGDWTRIISSPLLRAEQTAQAVWDVNKEEIPWKETLEALAPWWLGCWEGQPTLSILSKMNSLIKDHPDKTNPGRGPESVHDGCSFNEFKNRYLRYVLYLINDYDPRERILNVTHYRGVRLIQAWVKAGASDNMEVDVDIMTTKGDDLPCDLFMLDPKARMFKKVKRGNAPGIYFLRHGSTAYNLENHGAPSPNVPEKDEAK